MITYPFTEDGIEHALTALGTTPNAVATNLSAMGFRGCRDQESNCPVAHYLLASIPDMGTVGVFTEVFDGVTARIDDGHVEAGLGVAVDPLFVVVPHPVARFVIAFDKGDYPDLIEGGIRA